MRLRRKAAPSALSEATGVDSATEEVDDVARIDLGSMLVPHLEGRDVRVQVDEASGAVRSVVMVAEEGAVEFAAFAAPRNGDLWSTLRPQIVEDVLGRGGRATEREGRWGTELMCIVPVTQPDGTQSAQPSRMVAISGDRWVLRGTFFGRPAVEPAAESEWDEALAKVVVRRGSAAMPAGEPLPAASESASGE